MENKQIVGDYLNRQDFIDTIYQYIINNVKTNSKPICFGIDGEWGQGKTWIVDKLEKKLKGGDLFVDEEKEEYRIDKYFVFKYNAWELDYYEDPLIAILVTLVEQLNKIDIVRLDKALKEVLNASIKILTKLCGEISKKILGVDIVEGVTEIGKKIKNFNELSKMKIKASKNAITEDIDNLLIVLNNLSKYKPIVFLVDEIDRCLPEYTIKTLERLHHIFGKVNGSVTIVSTDKTQLSKSIESIYGVKYDANKYLQKFIMFSFQLSFGVIEQNNFMTRLSEINSKLGNKNIDSIGMEFLNNILKDLNAREQNLIFDRTLISLNTLITFANEFDDCDLLVGCLFIAALNYYRFTPKKEFFIHNISPYNGNTPNLTVEKYLKPYFISAKQIYNITESNKLSFILLYILAKYIIKEKNADQLIVKCEGLSESKKKEIETKIKHLANFYSINVIIR